MPEGRCFKGKIQAEKRKTGEGNQTGNIASVDRRAASYTPMRYRTGVILWKRKPSGCPGY